MVKTWTDHLERAVPATTLSLFRSLFALITGGYLIESWWNGQLFWMYVAPKFNFSLHLLPFPLPPPPAAILWLPFLILILASILVGLGRWVKAGLLSLFFMKAYLSFIDISWFNNHDYLFMLIALFFFLLDIPAGKKIGGVTSASVPIWKLWSFRSLFLVVYFYGGIAKLQWDWLDGSIVRQFAAGWIQSGLFDKSSFLGSVIASDFGVFFISYSGIVIDIIVAPLLLFQRTRLISLIILCSFHLMNTQLFNIGPFPWVSIAGLVIFLDPNRFNQTLLTKTSSLRRFVDGSVQNSAAGVTIHHVGSRRFWCVTIFLVIQVLLPLRRFAYEGPTTWHSNAHFFSWLMMGHSKELKSLVIWVEDSKTGRREEHYPLELLVEWQASRFGIYATHSVAFAKHLAKIYSAKGMSDPKVFMEIIVSYNGRPPQYFVSPKLDLASVEVSYLAPNSWVLPLDPPMTP